MSLARSSFIRAVKNFVYNYDFDADVVDDEFRNKSKLTTINYLLQKGR